MWATLTWPSQHSTLGFVCPPSLPPALSRSLAHSFAQKCVWQQNMLERPLICYLGRSSMHPDNKRYLIWLCSLMSQLKGACSSTCNEARRADCLQISRRRPLEALEHVQKREKKKENKKRNASLQNVNVRVCVRVRVCAHVCVRAHRRPGFQGSDAARWRTGVVSLVALIVSDEQVASKQMNQRLAWTTVHLKTSTVQLRNYYYLFYFFALTLVSLQPSSVSQILKEKKTFSSDTNIGKTFFVSTPSLSFSLSLSRCLSVSLTGQIHDRPFVTGGRAGRAPPAAAIWLSRLDPWLHSGSLSD